MGLLFLGISILLIWIIAALFMILISKVSEHSSTPQKTKGRWNLIVTPLLCILGVMMLLSVYHIACDSYKEGQVDYYKGTFKYIPVVHKSNDIIIDTIYIKK